MDRQTAAQATTFLYEIKTSLFRIIHTCPDSVSGHLGKTLRQASLTYSFGKCPQQSDKRPLTAEQDGSAECLLLSQRTHDQGI